MSQWTIQCDNLSKKFGSSLKRSMMYGMRDSLVRIIGQKANSEKLRSGEFWALQNINFELKQGESLGIMGVNGSGKSTLLRILNATYTPDRGEVRVRGRIGALIAAGAGFSPMLSGRENIFVSGALLGLNRQEILARMDEIIDFADIADSIDMPVKNYSSGMFVRLGFAIAALVEPEILLIDEVLAVGDLNFQKKCFDYILRLKKSGTSIILVSHSMGAIWSLCDRGLLLHKGKAIAEGPTEQIIRKYEEVNAIVPEPSSLISESDENLPSDYSGMKGGTGDAFIKRVETKNAHGEPCHIFNFGEDIFIESHILIRNRLDIPLFRYTIDAAHYRFISSVDSYEDRLDMREIEPGEYILKTHLKAQNLMPGAYRLNANISRKEFFAHIFFWNAACSFQITHPTSQFLYSEPSAVVKLNATMTIEQLSK